MSPAEPAVTGSDPAAWTVLGLLRTATRFLDEREVPEARLSAEHLLADVLGCGRLDLYLAFDRPLTGAEVDAFRERVRRRLRREPIQYITGRAAFRGLELEVDERVLVPRPETELLVGEVVDWAAAESRRGRRPGRGWRIVDVGTGSGAIALAVAAEVEGLAWVLGVDPSRAALDVARANAERAGASRVRWLAASDLDAIAPGAGLDAIVSNPPYLADAERAGLPAEVREWEPAAALFAGPRGDEALGRIVAGAPDRLAPGGLLALEVGAGQAGPVRTLIEAEPGLRFLDAYRDYAGIERGVLALAAA